MVNAGVQPGYGLSVCQLTGMAALMAVRYWPFHVSKTHLTPCAAAVLCLSKVHPRTVKGVTLVSLRRGNVGFFCCALTGLV